MLSMKFSFLITLFFVTPYLFAQQNKPSVDWKKFLPQSEIDQIILGNYNSTTYIIILLLAQLLCLGY